MTVICISFLIIFYWDNYKKKREAPSNIKIPPKRVIQTGKPPKLLFHNFFFCNYPYLCKSIIHHITTIWINILAYDHTLVHLMSRHTDISRDLDFIKASFIAPQISSFDHRKRDGILEWPRSCFDVGNRFVFFQSAPSFSKLL